MKLRSVKFIFAGSMTSFSREKNNVGGAVNQRGVNGRKYEDQELFLLPSLRARVTELREERDCTQSMCQRKLCR